MIRLFWLLLTVSITSQAQDSTIQYRPVRAIIKLAPLSLLLDPDATIQGGLEVRTGQRNAVQAEVGFGHKGLSVTKDEKKNFTNWSIWRVRSEWRHYTGRYRTNLKKGINIRSSFPLGNYVAIEGFAKQISGTREVSLDSPFSSSKPQTVPQTISRFVTGSHLKWGRQIAIPGESLTNLSRVLLDFYVGVGVRYGVTDLDPVTNHCGCGLTPNRFQDGRAFQPSVALGVKMGFGL